MSSATTGIREKVLLDWLVNVVSFPSVVRPRVV